MAGNMVKDMITNFGKLDKFEGHDFRRWQKKMHFLLTTLKVVYVLTIPMPELVKDATVEAIKIRAKWENDDYIYTGNKLRGLLDSKYMSKDSSSKKFLIFGIWKAFGGNTRDLGSFGEETDKTTDLHQHLSGL
ncbi:hypothetical protein Tco_0118506, partial [Tanacetum coccineum]